MNIPAYYCGEYLEYEKIRIPLADRSIFFADAVYDVAIGKNNKIYQLDEHLDRLAKSAEALKIILPHEYREIRQITENLLSRFPPSIFMLYIQIARCAPKRSHAFESYSKSSLLAFVEPIEEARKEDVKIEVAPDMRYRLCNVKTVNLLPAVLSCIGAPKDCAETVFVRDGLITECSHSNIFIYSGGVLKTAPVGESVLPGITRRNTLRLAEKGGIPISEESFTPEELFSADGVYITSTTKFIRRVAVAGDKTLSCSDKGVYEILYGKLFGEFEQFVYT